MKVYEDRFIYYSLMKDLVAQNISAKLFCKKFSSKRNKDVDEEYRLIDEQGYCEVVSKEQLKLKYLWYDESISCYEYIDRCFKLSYLSKEDVLVSILELIHSQDIEDFLPDEEHEEAANDPDPPLFPWITEAQLRERVKQKLEWIEAFEAHVIKRDGALPSICGPVLTDSQAPKNSSEIQ
jgi:hypothetical protein